ncbi:MAG: glycosyltransferase [Chitinophagaceae bacterium]
MNFPFISLIIPCYNESMRVHLLYDGLDEFAAQWKGAWEAIIVDDGSKDDTATRLKEHNTFSKYINHIHIISQSNKGKGGALQKGIEHAKGNFVLTLDADMAARPIELLKWQERQNGFKENELLIASRELNESIVDKIPHRKFIGNVFNFLIQSMTGLRLKDTQCGFKLYETELAKNLFSKLQTKGWAHDVEILCKAQKKGIAIHSMPVRWKAIEGSKINVIKDSFKMFLELLAIRQIIRRSDD